jgi:hypothetical protein
MGLGSRKPKSGSALHMYGVLGLLPNLSVKSDQKKVSLSRLSAPRLEMDSCDDARTMASKPTLKAATSASEGGGGSEGKSTSRNPEKSAPYYDKSL